MLQIRKSSLLKTARRALIRNSTWISEQRRHATLYITNSPNCSATLQNLLGKEDKLHFFLTSRMRKLYAGNGSSTFFSKIKQDIDVDMLSKYLGITSLQTMESVYKIDEDSGVPLEKIKESVLKASEIVLLTSPDVIGEVLVDDFLAVFKPTVPVKVRSCKLISALNGDGEKLKQHVLEGEETRNIIDSSVSNAFGWVVSNFMVPERTINRNTAFALQRIVEREMLRFSFPRSSYRLLSLHVRLPADASSDGVKVVPQKATLRAINGKRVALADAFDPTTGKLTGKEDFLMPSMKELEDVMEWLETAKPSFQISWMDKSSREKSPPPLYSITSLMVESQKMKLLPINVSILAQSLYDNGFITFPRSYSTSMSPHAYYITKSIVAERFGSDAVSPVIRSEVEESSELFGCEGIRPAIVGGAFVAPKDTGLEGERLRLYTLIYRRTLASVMVAAVYEDREYTIHTKPAAGDDKGFMAMYEKEASTRSDRDWKAGAKLVLSAPKSAELKPNSAVYKSSSLFSILLQEHQLPLPKRFTPASLISYLSAEAPLSYARLYDNLLHKLRSQNHVKLDESSMELVPTIQGLVIATAMQKHFPQLVDVTSGARLQRLLQRVSAGEIPKRDVLLHFFLGSGIKDTGADQSPPGVGFLEHLLVKLREGQMSRVDSTALNLPHLAHLGTVNAFRIHQVRFVGKAGQVWDLETGCNDDSSRLELAQVRNIMATSKPQTVEEQVESDDSEVSEGWTRIGTGVNGKYLQTSARTYLLPEWVTESNTSYEEVLGYTSLPTVLGMHPQLKEPMVLKVVEGGLLRDHKRKRNVLCVCFDRYDKCVPVPDKVPLHKVTAEYAQRLVNALPVSEILYNKKFLGFYQQHGVYLRHGDGFFVRWKENTIGKIPNQAKPEEVTLQQAIEMIEKKLEYYRKRERLEGRSARDGRRAARDKAAEGRSSGKSGEAETDEQQHQHKQRSRVEMGSVTANKVR